MCAKFAERQGSQWSSKIVLAVVLGCLLPTLTVSPFSSADDARIWTHKSGAKQKCVLVSQDESYCYLRRVDNGNQIKMSKRHLSPADQVYLKAAQLADDDLEQWGHVKDLVPLVYTDPERVEDSLIQFHNAYEESPYAGLLASVATCLGENKHKQAYAILRSVVTRIEDQRQSRPGAHALTLASCLNNQAICKLKLHKADSAAALFLRASQEANLPVIGFNGQMLANVTAADGGLHLTRRNHQKLLVEIPRSTYGSMLKDGYYYSTRVEEPTGVQSNLATLRTVAVKNDFTGRSIAASGSGFVIAQGWIATSRDVVSHDQLHTPTIGVLDLSSKTPVKIAADRVLVSTHPKFDVAFLHLPKLAAAPITLQSTAVTDGTELRLFGYSKQAQFKLLDHSGKAKRLTNRNGVFRAGITHQQGMGGSPAIDAHGALVGMAVAGRDGKPVEILDATFLSSLGGTANPPLMIQASQSPSAVQGQVDWKKIQKSVAPSVLPVVVYADPADINRMSPNSPGVMAGGSVNPQTESIVRDGWCIACDGKGIIDCPVKGCNKGLVTIRVPTVVGKRVDGADVITNKPVPDTCPTCSGRGVFRCQHCNEGKI